MYDYNIYFIQYFFIVVLIKINIRKYFNRYDFFEIILRLNFFIFIYF